MSAEGDDGKPWGYMHEVAGWLPLPKGPGLLAMGPPPFDVTLPDGRTRRVVHKPEGASSDEPPANDATAPTAASAAQLRTAPVGPDAPARNTDADAIPF